MSQAVPEQIANSRLSLISGQAFFTHLTDWAQDLPDRPWMPADFGRIFGQLRGGGGHGRYAFPWRASQRSAFWTEYCESTPVSQISAEAAQRLIVPLRLAPTHPPVVEITDGPERVFFDTYAYPYGIVTALTVQIATRTSLSLDIWRDRIRALRLGSGYAVTLPGGAVQSGLRGVDVLDMINQWARAAYFGQIDTIISSAEPFSIVAVIQGDGIDPAVPLSTRSDLQLLLNAITAWPVNWQATQPPPLAEACLPVSGDNISAGDAFYAAKRGRTLWRPALFTHRLPAGARLHTLSCLMHNQVAGTMQAESLRLFALRYGALTQEQRSQVSPLLRNSVAVQIDRFWQGQRTYRSASLQRLLHDKTSLAQVNELLTEMGLEPIA